MKEERFEKVVLWKKQKNGINPENLFLIFIWITMTQIMDSWYFNLFEYGLLGLLWLRGYKREVYYRRVK